MSAERRLLISFSGGETSALMSKLILERMSGEYDEIRTVFANTGKENPETLEFVQRCDEAYGLGVVWVEAQVADQRGQGTRAKVVDFATASRNGEPFEAVIAKYGIPNANYPHCTRELKGNPIRAYAKSIGWGRGTFDTAIGIRTDEIDRMVATAREQRLIYPLTSRFPHTKPMVNEFWAHQPFRLPLAGYDGNCQTCWKKSRRKLITIMRKAPEKFEWSARIEAQYGDAGAGVGTRVFYRGPRSTEDLRLEAADASVPDATDDAREYQVDLLDWLTLNSPLDPDTDLDACGAGEGCEVDFGDAA